MKKTREDTVKEVVSLQQDLNALSVDKINETAPKADPEPQTQLSMKEIAKAENVPYIEPKRKIKGFGKLPEKLVAEHKRDWEYVKGIFENFVVNGEPVKFWLSVYPGDPDCLWEIPANRPVYVPRMVAKHLEDVMKYHTFSYLEKHQQTMAPDDFTHQFTVTGTTYRGKFRAVGAFA